jgi:hypothetical protein
MCNCIILSFQLEDATLESFEKAVKKDNVPLTFDAFEDLQKLDEYLETWCIQMWDHGFLSMFQGADSYSKTKTFGDNKRVDLVVKKVPFRFISLFHFISVMIYFQTMVVLNSSIVFLYIANVSLCCRYFIKELLPKGAIQKAPSQCIWEPGLTRPLHNACTPFHGSGLGPYYISRAMVGILIVVRAFTLLKKRLRRLLLTLYMPQKQL